MKITIDGKAFEVTDSSNEAFLQFDKYDKTVLNLLNDKWLELKIDDRTYTVKCVNIGLFYEGVIKANVLLRQKTEYELLQDRYNKLLKQEAK